MARPRNDTLKLSNIGPIADVELQLGDLTLLVGPQGAGKSIALQLFKLCLDRLAVARLARDNGLVWKDATEFLDAYLGAGLGASWTKKSAVRWKGADLALPPRNQAYPGPAKVFYVPAQRALTVADGWPRSFSSYASAPFVVREFGLRLQQVLLSSRSEQIFPASARLKEGLRKAIDDAVFHTGKLELRQQGLQRELKIVHGGAELPYMAWSAGQREFAPLLLSLYELLPAAAKSKDVDIDWVVIEEPEMGLHPQAIIATVSLVLDLLHRGYRVIMSTHHPLVLDVVWLVRLLQSTEGARPNDLLKALGLPARGDLVKMAASVMEKECRVFALRHGERGVTSVDISGLDPGADDPAVAGWGGLTGLSARIQDTVAEVVARTGRDA